MALNCEIIPTVKFANSNRQPEESELFKSLLSYVGENYGATRRDVAVDLYRVYKDTDTLIKQYGDRLSLNDQNQVRFGDLLRETDLITYIDTNKLNKGIEKSLGKKISSDTTDNYIDAVQRIDEFNNNSEFAGAFVANIRREADEDGNPQLRIYIQEYTDQAYKDAQETVKANQLNQRIRNILYNAGVSVGAYDNLLNGLAFGMTDFKAAQTAGNGLIELIKLANGSIGETALPEEFAHFVLECLHDHPLAQRLVNLVKTQGLTRDILGDMYDQYYEQYNGDEDALAFEAASDLVRDSIFQGKVLGQDAAERLSERLKTAFSAKFKDINADSIRQAINEVVDAVEKISSYALSSSAKLSPKLITSTRRFFALNPVEAKKKKLLEDIITDGYKNFKLQKLSRIVRTEDLDKVKALDDERKAHLAALESYINNETNKVENFSLAIQSVIEYANKDLEKYLTWYNENSASVLRRLQSGEYPINKLATDLTRLKTTADYYRRILGSVQEFYTETRLTEPNFPTVVPLQDGSLFDILEQIAKTLANINNLDTIYQNTAAPVFIEFMKPYFGDEIEVPFTDALNLLLEDENNPGKLRKVRKGEKISMEMFVKNAVKDIGVLDRWFSSMSNSGDFINKLFATAVKESVTKARLRSDTFADKMKAEARKLQEAGITDYEWLFEKDDEGNITCNFVRDLNWGQCKKDRKKFKDDFKTTVMNNKPFTEWTPDEKANYRNALLAWDNEHRPYNVELKKRIPNPVYYMNPAYAEIMNNPAKKAFYNFVLENKKTFDSYMPNGQYAQFRAPIIMKDIVEVIRDRGLGVAIAHKVQAAKDYVGNLSDNLGFGLHDSQLNDEMDEDDEDENLSIYGKIRLVDFNNKPVDMLPIHYQKLRKEIKNKDGKVICQAEDPNDLSTDIVSTMIAYGDMAIKYNEMNEVINTLMMCKYYADNNQIIAQTDGDKPIMERIKRSANSAIRAIPKDNAQSRIVAQRNDFFEAQVFERWFANEGTIQMLGISKAQAANILNKVTSLSGLALNSLAGIANVEQGILVMNVETFARQFFDERDLVKADETYFTKMLPSFLAQVNESVKTNELELWSKKFNVLQDYDRKIRDINYQNNKFYRMMFGGDTLYIFNNIGEHWMQHRTFFALANSDEMVLHDADGNEVKLIDAYERKFIQKDNSLGDNDAGLGAKLVMKTGLYDNHGRRIITMEEAGDKSMRGYRGYKGETISEELYVNYVSRKCAEINHKMHGIYNTEDMNAAQRYAVGRMALLFRKWIAPSLQKKYAAGTFNFDLDEWTEGYYRTAFKFLKTLTKDLLRLQLNYTASYNELSDAEKANIRRAITEVTEFLSILGGLLLLDYDDAGNSPWHIQMLKWSLYRMRTEMGALMPSHYMLSEGLKLLRTPSADLSTIEKCIHLLGCLSPTNWALSEEDLIQSGKYKGHSYAYKYFMESPIMFYYNDFVNLGHPEYVIPFYKSAFGSYGAN